MFEEKLLIDMHKNKGHCHCTLCIAIAQGGI